MFDWLEIFTLVSGLLFLVLEIRQSNWMWAVQILTGITSVILFYRQGLYASMALNFYYIVSAVWGVISWRRDSGTDLNTNSSAGYEQNSKPLVKSESDADVNANSAASNSIHLRKLTAKVIIVSILLQIIGTVVMLWGLRLLGDPMSGLDAGITVLSLIATWWLIRTYKEQWLLWILADLLYVFMCYAQGMYFMSGLYAFYTVSAIYGFIHWRSNGKFVD